MQRVKRLIEERKKLFSRLRFFTHLEGEGTLDDIYSFVPGLTFFVLTFQDILRMNAVRVGDEALRGVASQHQHEDAGHEHWFLGDLRTLGAERDVGWLFGAEHRVTRDVSFELMSEVFRAESDFVRVVLPLALEATGDVFFSRVDGFFRRASAPTRIQYFSRMHHEVERAHGMFEEQHVHLIDASVLSEAEFSACCAAVDRVFSAMSRMCEDLYARIELGRASARAS